MAQLWQLVYHKGGTKEMITLQSTPIPPPIVKKASVMVQTPELVLKEMRARLPRTKFSSAEPTPVPNLTALNMPHGKQVYALDGSHYLIIGVIYNLDTGKTLQKQLNHTSVSKEIINEN